MSTTANWPVDEDIDDVLAADFDGSLSGLGMEIGTASFNMSDALMALPNITTLKEEKFKENGDLSQSSENQLSVMGLGRAASIPTKKTRLSQNADADVSSAIKRFCVNSDKEDGDSSQSSSCKHSSSVPDLRVTGSQSATPVAILSASLLSQMLHLCDSSSNANSNDISPSVKNYGFQYVLGAATSIATKLNEETMTYLNQGQPYEIKLKKLGDLTDVMGKTLKSVIRIGFQERRLQYMEKEQISQWQSERTGERILEIDIPLSYGVWDVLNDPNNIHMCEFLWDPTKETGIFVKVNCISTEFTPKKHGGEKGVPFRIQIETFLQSQDYSERMHVASCQIKVFKPKGADRKHKTDKEKMSRRRSVDQDKYRPSCDCTFFSECNPDSLYISPLTITASSATSNQNFSPTSNNVECGTSVSTLDQIPPTSVNTTEAVDAAEVLCTRQLISPSPVPDTRPGRTSCSPMKEESSSSFTSNVIFHSAHDLLSSEASATETMLWLQRNRFGSFVKVFSNFSGSDILKLSRDDFIQICGLADGIRLYNVVRSKAVRPRLTMYVCLPTEKDNVIPIFSAIYLENYALSELKAKFALLLKIPNDIPNIFIIGPSAIRVIVTDEVLRNISNDSMFIVELHKDKSNEVQGVLLKPYT